MPMNGIEISRAEPARTRAPAWKRDEKDPAMPYNAAQVARRVMRPDLRVLGGGAACVSSLLLGLGKQSRKARNVGLEGWCETGCSEALVDRGNVAGIWLMWPAR